ncbi:MAG: hypothetical protein AAGM22_08435 [Acidobacteriota bacterium]
MSFRKIPPRVFQPKRRFGQRASTAFLGALSSLLLLPTTVTAQAADEVWILPAFYVPDDGTDTSGCQFYNNKEIRTTAMLDSLQATEDWPTTNQRLAGFSFLQNLMLENSACTTFTSSSDVADIAAWTNGDRDGDGTEESDALQIGVISRSFFITPPSETPSTSSTYQTALDSSELCNAGDHDPGYYGTREANNAYPLYKRWLQNDGRIDYVQVDFPMWRTYEDVREAELVGADCPDGMGGRQDLHDIWTIRRMAQEIAAFMEQMQSRVTNDPDAEVDFPAAQRANYDPNVFLWTAVGFEQSPGDPGANVIGNGEELTYVLECVRYFLEGGGSESACYVAAEDAADPVTAVTGDPIFEGLSIDADPNFVESQGDATDWNFERVIGMQDVARAEGYEVGISNHMGPCGQGRKTSDGELFRNCDNESAQTATDFNQWARDTFLRYADEFVAAGGRPDHLMLNQWLYYPATWGTEFDDPTAPGFSALSEITKEVLTDTYPRPVPIDYVDDDFSDESNWQDHYNCFTATTSGSVNILEDAAWNNGSSNRCFMTLKTDASAPAEEVVDFDLTFNVKWTDGSPTPSDPSWAGVAFRKADPLDPPWTSGYLLAVGDGSTLTLSRKNGKIWTATLAGDPNTGNGVELTVVARGDWIRVYEGQDDEPLINIVDRLDAADITAGVTLDTSGHIGFATIFAEAHFAEPFSLTRVDRQAFGDFFEGYDTTTLGSPWTSVSRFTVNTSDTTDQKLTSSSAGFSSATVDGFNDDNVRISGTVIPGGVGLWGGLQVRKVDDDAPVWLVDSGYAAVLKQLSSGAEVSLVCKDCTDAGTIETMALPSVPSDGYVVDLEAIGDRIRVYVDGELKIDHFEIGPNRPTSGTVGAAALAGAGTEIDDVFVMEPLY